MDRSKLRRQIAWEAARLMYDRRESEYFRAKMKAARYIFRGRVKPADLPSSAEIRDDKSPFYVELEQHELIATHEVELARDEHDYLLKQRKLTEESMQNDLKFRRAQVEALEASLQRMGENLEIVKRKQDDLTIKAPVDGQLTALNAEVGQLKMSGERLGQIDILKGFKLRAAVDEQCSSWLLRRELSGLRAVPSRLDVDEWRCVRQRPFGVLHLCVPEHCAGAGRWFHDRAIRAPLSAANFLRRSRMRRV